MFHGLLHAVVFRQCITTAMLALFPIHWGFSQGFSAILIPQLLAANSSIPISNEEASWIVSLFAVSVVIGSFLNGIYMELYGRRTAIQTAFAMICAGWVLLTLSKNVYMLYIGRILQGLATGATTAVTVYIVESSIPTYRVQSLAANGSFITVGILICYIVGHFLPWRHAALLYVITSCCSPLLVFIIPESPVWLLANNKIKEAFESFKWMRNAIAPKIVAANFEQLKSDAQNSRSSGDKEPSYMQTIINTKAWKPFFIIQVFFFLQQLNGYNILICYCIQFFEYFDLPIDVFIASSGYGAAYMFASFFFVFVLAPRLGRKTLTVVSAAGNCTFFSLAAAYLYWFADATDKPFFWVPVVFTWIGAIFCVIGMGPLPWQMCGELLPSPVRGFLTGVLYMSAFFYMFLGLKLFPLVLFHMPIYIVLLIPAGSAFILVFFGWFVLPETYDKTLEDIEKLW